MRTGYAIRDRHGHAWLMTRERVEGVDAPVTVWVKNEDDAMVFRRLKEAKRILKLLRKSSPWPNKICIKDPRYREVS